MANIIYFFQGVQQALNTILTNPYYGLSININGIYNVNTGTYFGDSDDFNTLLMTNVTDALFILDANSLPTLENIDRIVMGNGDDLLNLASTEINLGNLIIFGGAGDQIIWTNSGNDTINAGNGNNQIVVGPGNNTLNGGSGQDTIYLGPGNNIASSNGGDDELIYNLGQNFGATDTFNGGTGTDTLTMMITAAESNAYGAEITGAMTFITSNYNPAVSNGPSYTFASLGLTFSNVENINIVITANSVPVAQDDDFAGTQDQLVAGNVLADNGHGADSDPDGDPLSVTATVLTTAAGGLVNLSANGSFTYTNAGFNGSDSFAYTLNDNHGGSTTGMVSLTISPPLNQNPVAQDDDFSSVTGATVSGNVLADNGNDVDADPDNDSLSVVAFSGATSAGGSVILNADGTFAYTPGTGFIGTDSFDYTLLDGEGGSDTGTATFTIAAPAGAIVGTEGDDTLNGTVHDDVIFGLGGNDTISGDNGNDVIYGGAGDDVIHGDNGQDIIYAMSGNNVLFGDNGKDILYAGSGSDTLYGGNGSDTIVVGTGHATMTGGHAPDTFRFTDISGTGTITDFSGDIIDFLDLIEISNPQQQGINDFVHATVQGSDMVLSVDVDGVANGSNFVAVATLQGIQNFDVAAMAASGDLIV